MYTKLFAGILCIVGLLSVRSQVEAMPVFAQRYQLTCKTCHTVLPELNNFGNDFRNRGYRLPPNVPRHGTTIAALRYNVEWERDPAAGARRPRFSATPTSVH